MKETITIEIPEGKTYKQTVDKDGNIIIQYIDKEPVRSRSWEEFCENHPIIDNEWYFDNTKTWAILGLHQLERTKQKSLLSTKEDAEGILALIQLTRLHDEWVDNWKPNWENCNNKYSIIFCNNTAIIDLDVHNSRLLVFSTYQIAQEFLECFKDLIEKAKRFI